jgi:NitT/TauT family transport system substrate-binding protein
MFGGRLSQQATVRRGQDPPGRPAPRSPGGHMKYKSQGLTAAAAAAAVLAGLLSGCSAANGASAPPVEKHDLTVGAVPVADSAALYIAQQRGFFKAEGLHVKIEPVVSAETAIPGQLAGKYDVVLGNYVSYVLADAEHGDDFRVLYPGAAESPGDSVLLVPHGSPIQSVADLRGKTVAINAPNNIGALLVTSMLSDYMMGPKADHIRFVAIPFPLMAHALITHKVDAAMMFEPFATEAEMQGAEQVADADAGSTQNLPIAGYMVTKSWERKYPGTAAAFRHALQEGQNIASADPLAVYKGLETYAKIPANVAQIISLPSYPLSNNDLSLQRIPNLMLNLGMLDHSFDVNEMLH